VSRGKDAVRVLARWVGRAALLAAWALVGWGTLLLIVALANVASRGPRSAVGELLPAPGAGVWDWANGIAAAVAFLAWVCVGGLLVLARRSAPRSVGEDDDGHLEESVPPERAQERPTD
jgi:hypothetical protein